MTPFQDDGRFRFDGQKDRDFQFFHVAMSVYDSSVARLEQINQLCETREFHSIYGNRGAPAYYRFYVPLRVSGDWKIDFHLEKASTRPLRKPRGPDYYPYLRALRHSIRTAGKKLTETEHRRLGLKFYRWVIASRCSVIGSICSAVHQLGMDQLLSLVKHERDDSIRKEALLKLVKLDSGCLTAPGADAVIRAAAVGGDREFLLALSKAVDPDRRLVELEDQRNRHALTILAYSMHFEERTIDDYLEFFEYYNLTIAKAPGFMAAWLFPNFLQRDTIRKALKLFDIRYRHRPKGQPRKRLNPK